MPRPKLWWAVARWRACRDISIASLRTGRHQGCIRLRCSSTGRVVPAGRVFGTCSRESGFLFGLGSGSSSHRVRQLGSNLPLLARAEARHGESRSEPPLGAVLPRCRLRLFLQFVDGELVSCGASAPPPGSRSRSPGSACGCSPGGTPLEHSSFVPATSFDCRFWLFTFCISLSTTILSFAHVAARRAAP